MEARAAVKRDREPLKNRPMFISPSEPDAALKHPAFKFQTSLEKRKLFVKGLATSTTKEDVEKLFSQYGTLKDVRLVTFKSGVSKGQFFIYYLSNLLLNIIPILQDWHTSTLKMRFPPPPL